MSKTGFEVPEEGEVSKLAFSLLGSDNPLDLAILEDLLAEPRRFRDLRPLVPGKSETPLTRALDRLADAGLIRHGMNVKDAGDPRYYAATRLGVQVHNAVTEHRLIAEIREARHAVAA